MFNFYSMAGNYDSRKVDRFEQDGMVVSTVMVTDSPHPYETAVRHPRYNDGKLIIVQTYDTKADAKAGHVKWVAAMTANKLPEAITDVSAATIAQMADLAGTEWRKKPMAK